jgi:hypothetical protein
MGATPIRCRHCGAAHGPLGQSPAEHLERPVPVRLLQRPLPVLRARLGWMSERFNVAGSYRWRYDPTHRRIRAPCRSGPRGARDSASSRRRRRRALMPVASLPEKIVRDYPRLGLDDRFTFRCEPRDGVLHTLLPRRGHRADALRRPAHEKAALGLFHGVPATVTRSSPFTPSRRSRWCCSRWIRKPSAARSSARGLLHLPSPALGLPHVSARRGRPEAPLGRGRPALLFCCGRSSASATAAGQLHGPPVARSEGSRSTR